MFGYPALFRQRSYGWSARVQFPDGSESAEVKAETLVQASHLAREQIHQWMVLLDTLRQRLPEMAPCPGPAGHQLVAPKMSYLWAMHLRFMRRSRGWTQQEAAASLGICQASYCVLEDFERCNPTLKTMERIYQKWDMFITLRPSPRGEFAEAPQWPYAPLRRKKGKRSR